MLTSSTSPLPGIYPLITKHNPQQTGNGKDNLGMGHTQHGEQFLLKPGGAIGVAEFIGAKVADVCGIPTCQPTVVTIEHMLYGLQHVFGSRIESGRVAFDQADVQAWRDQMAICTNPQAFSAMLAVDLVLGNDDRHWENWLLQATKTDTGQDRVRLRGLDFSRSWPLDHPPQHPGQHRSANTWRCTRDWALLGIEFDRATFDRTCVKIALLNQRWLHDQVLRPITGVFLTQQQADAYCHWWGTGLRGQVIEAIHSMDTGAPA
jgi:hypothetical protein